MGISFPFGADEQAFPAPSTDEALIKENLVQLILMSKGERIMRPELGTGAQSFVFEDNDDLLASFIRTTLTNAISTYEPRVILQRIDVVRDRSSSAYFDTTTVTVYYVVSATQTADSVSVSLGVDQGPTEV